MRREIDVLRKIKELKNGIVEYDATMKVPSPHRRSSNKDNSASFCRVFTAHATAAASQKISFFPFLGKKEIARGGQTNSVTAP